MDSLRTGHCEKDRRSATVLGSGLTLTLTLTLTLSAVPQYWAQVSVKVESWLGAHPWREVQLRLKRGHTEAYE